MHLQLCFIINGAEQPSRRFIRDGRSERGMVTSKKTEQGLDDVHW